MFSEMIAGLARGRLPDKGRLCRRFDMAMTKKMAVLRLPPAFWMADSKINPRVDHLFWAALLLLDRERMDLALAVLAEEQSERLRTNPPGRQALATQARELLGNLLDLIGDKQLQHSFRHDLERLAPEWLAQEMGSDRRRGQGMGIEIERKFLVVGTAWKENGVPVSCCQGYLCPGSGVTVRVRTMDDRGFLTVKGRGAGLARLEYEYEIPVTEAREMLDSLCVKPLIVKDRYRVVHDGLVWEVDEFAGENRGLVLAEVELSRPDQEVHLPAWAGREVSGDPRYYNAALVSNPYTRWPV